MIKKNEVIEEVEKVVENSEIVSSPQKAAGDCSVFDSRFVFPNFLCVGAQKSGTTTFSAMLRQHLQVFASEIKEPRYFNRESYNITDDHSEYSANFENSACVVKSK